MRTALSLNMGGTVEGRRGPGLGSRLRGGGSLLLVAALFGAGAAVALVGQIPVARIMDGFSYDVLVILICMELFTNLVAETGVMQLLALRIARISGGRKRACLVLFGTMLFLISACLNNITAVMVVLPIVLLLLKTLEVDRKYVCRFFAVLLALSNTGGAASPIGDFPAIVITTSGIVSFLGYLTHAFPLFLLTSAALLAMWGLSAGREQDDGALRRLAVDNLRSQYKHLRLHTGLLKGLGAVFAGMFLAWSVVPQQILPPEVIALLGYGAAMVMASAMGVKVVQLMDLKSVFTIAAFLFFAQVVSQTGLLSLLAGGLQAGISDPKLLVMAIMLITSLVSGLFSAGPAAAAMMPVVVELCSGPLSAQADWVAVAYAASICSGSSLFLWSATAGMVLSNKIQDAGLEEEGGAPIRWGVREYLSCGVRNYAVQMLIALGVIAAVL